MMKKHYRLALFYKLWRDLCALGFERSQTEVARMAAELVLEEAPRLCRSTLPTEEPPIVED